ncbi:MAG TPA: PAN domain-containing protein, partial [Thermoanaerobaculia bacterium]|nr:PAN domain-containing protein [Thermoanaerobaculia bacterium]
DRPGGDYTNFRTTELRECQRACAKDRRCAAYTFNSVNSLCYLKDQVTKTSYDSRTISGVKEGGGPGPGGGDRFLSEERGSDYRGGDYTNFRSRGLGDCQDACRRDRRCQAYTFNGRSGVCYLKDRVGDRERNGETVTGRKGRDDDGPHHGGGDLSREPGFDYYGGDYTNFRSPGDEGCREECRRDRRCAAYTFNMKSGMCYLKDQAGPLRRNSDTVTGIKRRR